MAAAQSPLRRWKRFFPSFAAIDAAIEAGCRPRDAFRSARGGIVELLCGAEDDGLAEELCRVLDDAMAESLVTLRLAPATARALTSTDLAKAVAALGQQHESARVRSLARDVVRGWRASVEGDLARARAAMEVLDKISDEQIRHESLPSVGSGHSRSCRVPFAADEDEKKRQAPPTKTASVGSSRVGPAKSNGAVKVAAPLPKKSAPVVAAGRVNAAKMDAATKTPQMQIKKMLPVIGNSGGDRVTSDKMEATKRKLRESYQEVEDAKRQRRIQVIEAPKMMKQRQRKMHPIMRERSQARCASSTAVRRSLMPSLQRI